MENKLINNQSENDDSKGKFADLLKLIGPFIIILLIYYLFFA
jgi:hypothetical protein